MHGTARRRLRIAGFPTLSRADGNGQTDEQTDMRPTASVSACVVAATGLLAALQCQAAAPPTSSTAAAAATSRASPAPVTRAPVAASVTAMSPATTTTAVLAAIASVAPQPPHTVQLPLPLPQPQIQIQPQPQPQPRLVIASNATDSQPATPPPHTHLGKLLTQQQQQQQAVQAPSPKLLQLGWALASSLALAALLAVLCVAASQAAVPTELVYTAAAAVFGLYIAVLSALPKVAVGSPIVFDDTVDGSFYPRIVFVLFVSLFAVVGCAGILIFYVFSPVYAIKPSLD
ncbi:hypothetical protein BC831DRAFT_461345 [Entophlyctis helioformis]|nr:hypothetical protein BC831DRAFT_461345 [Entophlyctis helioformis]